ncbi:hypothetical protein [Oceanobacter antarcticus]|uniref:Uncharacterized protein n=1 Tax=Oceanobacter antarcticus TaxID=3133425 RepID=A0ABW8NHG7_9GAMM
MTQNYQNYSLSQHITLPTGHCLKFIKSYSKGTLQQDDYKEFYELGQNGDPVAHYLYWERTSIKPPFRTSTGYCKSDLAGKTLEEVQC